MHNFSSRHYVWAIMFSSNGKQSRSFEWLSFLLRFSPRAFLEIRKFSSETLFPELLCKVRRN